VGHLGQKKQTLEFLFWKLSPILKLSLYDDKYYVKIFSINMKIHQIISSINDFICIHEIAGELDTVLPLQGDT
jgi:hypothetical protein